MRHMVRSLAVFYLHRAHRLDARRLPVVEYGLADALRDFCRETFDTVAPLDYPPLKLVVAGTAGALAKALFTSGGPRGVLTEAGRAADRAARGRVRATDEILMRGFSAEESAALRDLLLRMRQNILDDLQEKER